MPILTSKHVRYAIETLLVNALIFSTLYQLLVYLANRRFWRRDPQPAPDDFEPSISVIVPLRGKTPDTLALLHLIAITGPTPRYEVILVVEDEQDPAYPIAQEVAAHYPGAVRALISGPAGSHAGTIHNLNAGVQAATGDVIAFVDANVQVSAELWNAALAALAVPSTGAVFAPPLTLEPEQRTRSAVPGSGGDVLIALYSNHMHGTSLPLAALYHRLRSLSGGFIVLRRAVLDEMGGLLHLLDDVAEDISLGRAVREIGYQIEAVPVPARIVAEPATMNDATNHLLRKLITTRACQPPAFWLWPLTNPLHVGFLLSFITEHEGRWWGRRTWWFFIWLRLAIAYDLDRIRLGRSFSWMAYAQLFMLDTFFAPALWARALVQRTFIWRGSTYRMLPGGKAARVE